MGGMLVFTPSSTDAILPLWPHHHHPHQLQDHTISGADAIQSDQDGATCQDCGNQAKKDCTYRRCRTCCRSRGFECSTHVKSTWVPAARRRERQLMVGTDKPNGGASSGSTSGTKKPRLLSSDTSTSNTPSRSFDNTSSYQDARLKESLPGQVTAPAVFKCVRVTSVEDGEDEFAYQAVVKIGGHVFKGFLYDQGLDPTTKFPNFSDLHLSSAGGGHNGGGSGGDAGGGLSTMPVVDHADVYGSGTLFGGSTYGNNIN